MPTIDKSSFSGNAKGSKKTHSQKPEKVKYQHKHIPNDYPRILNMSPDGSAFYQAFKLPESVKKSELSDFGLDLSRIINAILQQLNKHQAIYQDFIPMPYSKTQHQILISNMFVAFAEQILCSLSAYEQEMRTDLSGRFFRNFLEMPESVVTVINFFGNIYADLCNINANESHHTIDNLIFAAVCIHDLSPDELSNYQFAERLFYETDVGRQKLISDTKKILASLTISGMKAENTYFHPTKIENVSTKDQFLWPLTHKSELYPILGMLYDLAKGSAITQEEFKQIRHFYAYDLDFSSISTPRIDDKLKSMYSNFQIEKCMLRNQFHISPLTLSFEGSLRHLFSKYQHESSPS